MVQAAGAADGCDYVSSFFVVCGRGGERGVCRSGSPSLSLPVLSSRQKLASRQQQRRLQRPSRHSFTLFLSPSVSVSRSRAPKKLSLYQRHSSVSVPGFGSKMTSRARHPLSPSLSLKCSPSALQKARPCTSAAPPSPFPTSIRNGWPPPSLARRAPSSLALLACSSPAPVFCSKRACQLCWRRFFSLRSVLEARLPFARGVLFLFRVSAAFSSSTLFLHSPTYPFFFFCFPLFFFFFFFFSSPSSLPPSLLLLSYFLPPSLLLPCPPSSPLLFFSPPSLFFFFFFLLLVTAPRSTSGPSAASSRSC